MGKALLALLLALVLAQTAGAVQLQPSLRIVSLDPVSVSGRGFQPAERVKLLVTANGAMARWVRADRRGSFVVRFGVSVQGRGGSLVVQAFGSRGSRAMVDVAAPELALLGP